MAYEVDEEEKDADELECWVCGGVAKNITRKITYSNHPKINVREFD